MTLCWMPDHVSVGCCFKSDKLVLSLKFYKDYLSVRAITRWLISGRSWGYSVLGQGLLVYTSTVCLCVCQGHYGLGLGLGLLVYTSAVCLCVCQGHHVVADNWQKSGLQCVRVRVVGLDVYC